MLTLLFLIITCKSDEVSKETMMKNSKNNNTPNELHQMEDDLVQSKTSYNVLQVMESFCQFFSSLLKLHTNHCIALFSGHTHSHGTLAAVARHLQQKPLRSKIFIKQWKNNKAKYEDNKR